MLALQGARASSTLFITMKGLNMQDKQPGDKAQKIEDNAKAEILEMCSTPEGLVDVLAAIVHRLEEYLRSDAKFKGKLLAKLVNKGVIGIADVAELMVAGFGEEEEL